MITSPDNTKLKLVRKLRERRGRRKEGLFATEGEDLVSAGRQAGAEPLFVLVRDGSGLEGDAVVPELLDGASGLGSGTRAIAVWPIQWAGSLGERVVFLDRPSDPGNVGTIIRTVDGLLSATVVIGPEGADPFSPAAVRASMGSIFSQPVIQAGIEDCPGTLIGLVPSGGTAPGPTPESFTLCLGSEREGLSPEVLNRCSERWTIEMREQGPESLNLAAAAAIACHHVGFGPGGGSRRSAGRQ